MDQVSPFLLVPVVCCLFPLALFGAGFFVGRGSMRWRVSFIRREQAGVYTEHAEGYGSRAVAVDDSPPELPEQRRQARQQQRRQPPRPGSTASTVRRLER